MKAFRPRVAFVYADINMVGRSYAREHRPGRSYARDDGTASAQHTTSIRLQPVRLRLTRRSFLLQFERSRNDPCPVMLGSGSRQHTFLIPFGTTSHSA